MKKALPPIILFFLAPAIGELPSGSSPPVEFFKPFSLILLATLYGGGAIIARELKIRWGKGWPSLLLLGAAYGIIEEGLMAKSFFNPDWMDIGILGSYGRWAGVNWVWSAELTIYHAIVSISIPIFLVELVFPSRRSVTWVGGRGLGILSVLLLVDIALGYFLLTPYRPNLLSYFVTLVCVVTLVLVARYLPHPLFSPRDLIARRPVWFWLTGFSATIVFFIIFWGLPYTPLPPVITILLGLGLLGLTGFLVLRMSGNGTIWSDTHRLALATGVLSMFILFAPIQELNRTSPDNPSGMTIVGVVAALFLAWLWWRVRRRARVDTKTLLPS